MVMEDKEKYETTSSNGGEEEEEEEREAWGTLEELLLVCAVDRHGTKSWDAIAKELQKRMKKHLCNEAFSAHNCKQKYVNLKRRFHGGGGDAAEEEEEERESDERETDELLRMADELRKLRVEELKREVQRHDVSIVSLQLKVKRLEEEREKEKEKEEEASDLRIEPEENATRTGEKAVEPERTSAENRSFNESNAVAAGEPDEPDPVRTGKKRRSEPVLQRVQQQQHSSDVQSSASLSKKKRRRFRGGGSSGDELEAEEVSPANKRISIKSQPLNRFLEILRSHKHGSVFQRRLPSQETEKYGNLIRQHMDLDTVQSKLDKGIYCDCHPKFYRDLLLVFTNAVLFYRKSSAEHIAARELRKLVIDEIALRIRKPVIQPMKPDPESQLLEPVVKKPRTLTNMVVCRRRNSSSMQALSESLKKKDETKNTTSANNKSNSSKVGNVREEKMKVDQHQKVFDGRSINSNNALASKKEKEGGSGGGGCVTATTNSKKVVTGERSNLGRGGLRLSNNNSKKIISKEGGKREKIGSASNNDNNNNNKGGNNSEVEGTEALERKKIGADQKQEKATPVLKKQGAANFLKRMKQNSPSSQERAKNNNSEEDEEEDQKKKEKTESNNNNVKKTGVNTKRNTREVEASVTRTSGRRVEREAAASRRAIGRPPKRKAAMMSGSTPDSGKGGRSVGRDSGEKSKKKPKR